MIKIEQDGECQLKFITILRGHSGSIRSLIWDEEKQLLLSCSADKSIFIWAIGEGKGQAIQLNAHGERINDIAYCAAERKLFSFGADKKLIIWNLRTERQQTALWAESNECQICQGPFFWNVQKLWQEKNAIFKRQHHCRRCGQAVCGECSPDLSILPMYGYEYPVRLCHTCYQDLSEEELCSSTQSHNILINPSCVDFDYSKKLLAVGCADNVIRLYDVAACLWGALTHCLGDLQRRSMRRTRRCVVLARALPN